MKYTGHYVRFVPFIEVEFLRGQTPSQIRMAILRAPHGSFGVNCSRADMPSREVILYILRRNGLAPPAQKSEGLSWAHGNPRNMGLRFYRDRVTRPLDMGGKRDTWHDWTPEKQWAEFMDERVACP